MSRICRRAHGGRGEDRFLRWTSDVLTAAAETPEDGANEQMGWQCEHNETSGERRSNFVFLLILGEQLTANVVVWKNALKSKNNIIYLFFNCLFFPN